MWALQSRRWSLYDDGKEGWYTGPGVSAGWDRPYGKYRQVVDAPLSQGPGEFLLWEFPLAFWMEQEGYDVSYTSNVDTHADGKGLRRARAFLSVGHDEYWSLDMFRNAKAAVGAGAHAAFLSGNAVDGLVAMLPNGAGVPHRAISRVGLFGGVVGTIREKPAAGRWKRSGPDPRALMGARTTMPANGGADWTCVREGHWLFAGTGMNNGDRIPGLVGWEHHGEPADLAGLEVVARGPVFSNGRPQEVEYTAVVFPGPKKNVIFNAATIWWADGLSAPPGYVRPSAHGNRPKGPDRRVGAGRRAERASPRRGVRHRRGERPRRGGGRGGRRRPGAGLLARRGEAGGVGRAAGRRGGPGLGGADGAQRQATPPTARAGGRSGRTARLLPGGPCCRKWSVRCLAPMPWPRVGTAPCARRSDTPRAMGPTRASLRT